MNNDGGPFEVSTAILHTTTGDKVERIISSNVEGLRFIRYVPLTIEEKCEQLNKVWRAALTRARGGGA